MNDLQNNIGVVFDTKDYAGFFKRVIIATIDLILILLVSAAFYFFSDYIIYDNETFMKSNFFFILLFSLWYLAILKRSKFRTVGYIITGVKIVDLKGQKPSIFKMVLRVLLLLIGPFELIIDIIWLTSEKTKQTLRDKYVGTYVVSKDALPIGTGKLQIVSLGVMGWNMMYREVKESVIK